MRLNTCVPALAYAGGVPPPPAARDKVLDAFEAILLAHGERAATLEAVAAAAGVSKGGLLYHFGSKQALMQGLLERLEALVDKDVEAMRTAIDGPAAFYIRTSAYTGSALDRAIVATSRLAQGSHPEAVQALQSMRQRWFDVLVDAVDDPAVARAVMLIGDGLYYNAAMDDGWAGTTSPMQPTDIDDLLVVVADLIRSRAPSSS
jgi:AcrR family transcriptional regulator